MLRLVRAPARVNRRQAIAATAVAIGIGSAAPRSPRISAEIGQLYAVEVSNSAGRREIIQAGFDQVGADAYCNSFNESARRFGLHARKVPIVWQLAELDGPTSPAAVLAKGGAA